MDIAPGLTARLSPITDPECFGNDWRQVEAQAGGSVFQSWTWLGCRFAARFHDPLALQIMNGSRCVAIGVLNRERRWTGPSWHLGETGDSAADSVFIEHNGPLVVQNCPQARDAWFAALMHAPVGPGRMIVLSGIGTIDLAAARRHGVVTVSITRVAPRRDLAALRRDGMDCLDPVSANTRQQINRAWRRYAASGPIHVEPAKSRDQAHEFMTGLTALHQTTWQGRGRQGAFARREFRDFHDDLLRRGIESGTTDLLRISAGSRLIGYLYTLIWRGTASAYQSGFVYEIEHPHEKPGLVCHVAAMRHYQARGLNNYDFLAGDDRYKTSLAGESTALHWARAAPRFTLAGAILLGRDRLKQWRPR